MRVITSFVFAVSSIALVAACGDDGGGDKPIDAPEVNPASCTVSALNFGDKGALTGNAQYTASQDPAIGSITFIAPLEGAAPSDILFIEMYPGFAPFGTEQAPTAVVPGTYPLTGDQLNYATCGTCVRILTNATDTAFDDHYLVTAGTLTVTAADSRVGGNLAFSVSGLKFEHVTIDENTFQSTPTNDGCHANISAATASATLADGSAKPGQTIVAPLQRALALRTHR